MAVDDLMPNEQEALELLRANDERAAESLLGLDDAGRARVLALISGSTTPEVSPTSPSDVAAGGSDSESGKFLGVLRRPLGDKGSKSVMAVVGLLVIVVVVVGVFVGGRSSDSMLLVRESGDDLYVGEAGGEIGRDNRVVQDFVRLQRVAVASEGVWRSTGLAAVGSLEVVVAEAEDGFGVWAINGLEYEEIISESRGAGVIVADEALYVWEVRDSSWRCYRGSAGDLGDLERVTRGDFCTVTRSGHVMGVDQSDDSYRVRVWAPEGGDEELLRANFAARPVISENGLFLVGVDDRGVTVTSVESGDRVWELDGGVGFELASHPDGYIAVAVEAEGGEVVLTVLDRDGTADEITEVTSGTLDAEFAASGDLFWIERMADGDSVLSVWDASDDHGTALVDERDLNMVGVYKDSAVTVKEDDFGALFERFSLIDSSGVELHEFEDEVRGWIMRGDFLYVIGSETVSVVPLSVGDPVDSFEWDRVRMLDSYDGVLVAVGHDGSFEILFSIRAGSDDDVEYGQYDEVVSAQLYGNTLYATVRDGSDIETLAFVASSGDAHDNNIDYDGYRLINSRESTIRSYLSAPGNRVEPFASEESGDVDAGAQLADEMDYDGQYYSDYYSASWISIGGLAYEDDISSSGQIHSYVFEVPGDGTLVILETRGSMDTYIELFQLLSPGRESIIDSNDDGGESTNARIALWLESGWYIVTVTGYSGSTGDYTLVTYYS